MIETGSDLKCYNSDGDCIALLGFGNGKITPDAYYIKELMARNEIHVFFNWRELASDQFKRGDYILLPGTPEKRFALRNPPVDPTFNPRNGGFQYELIFEAFEMFWQDIIMFYTFSGLKESEWILTGTATQHMQIAVDNINAHFNSSFTVGQVDSSEILQISYDSQNVFDGLTDIAETFGCEWYVDYEAGTVNLVASHETGEPVTLQREKEIAEIKVSNENSDDYCTRLYAFGSTRNIPRNYRSTGENEVVDAIAQKRLRMPISTGDYLDAFPDMNKSQIIEKVKVFDHIYPKRIGTITDLRIDDTKKDENGKPFIIYYFKDSGLNFSEKYILPGETLKASFSSGWMQGYDCELSYNDKTKEFEIINDQSIENHTIPNDLIRPRIGDEYVLYGFDITLVGDQYVGEAEKELREEALKYQTSLIEDNATYNCVMDSVAVAKQELYYEIGQRVELVSLMFKSGKKASRIRGFEQYLGYCGITYAVGDKPRYSRLKSIDKKIEKNKEIADMQYLEAMKAAKGALKTAKALNYLREALENSTTIKDGLVLSTLIMLGHMVGGEWKANAGMNGINRGENDVAFWAGGTLDQAVNAANDPNRTDDIAQFVVTHLGKLIANDVHLRGRLESNKNGSRIVIDPEERVLKLMSEDNVSIAQLKQYPWSDGSGYGGALELNDNKLGTKSYFYPESFAYSNKNDDYIMHFTMLDKNYLGFFMGHNSDHGNKQPTRPLFYANPYDGGDLLVVMNKLPKSSDWLQEGQLWNDNGVLKIHTIEE